MKDSIRTEENKKDQNLESVLTILNDFLLDDEQELTAHFKRPKYPPVFIVGNARSGTTLLYQWLASTKLFTYPSNVISRFYKAPYVGALIHKAFIDYDKHNEILGKEKIIFESTLGKTKNAVSPHEFWYFWQRFFKFGEIQRLSEKELNKVNSEEFLRELAALEGAFGKPLLMKAMILNWNLEFLHQLLPNAIFIHIQRDPIMNMHSLFNARKKYFGSVEKWYSFKPPEYKWLKNGNIYEQLAGQVICTHRKIESYLNTVSNSKLTILYKDICENPAQVYEKIHSKLREKGLELTETYTGPLQFELRNNIINKEFSVTKAQKAISKILSTAYLK